MQLLKVTSESDPATIARAIVAIFRRDEQPELTAIAAEAKARALDAILDAGVQLAPLGVELVCKLGAVVLDHDGRPRTAVRLALEARRETRRPGKELG